MKGNKLKNLTLADATKDVMRRFNIRASKKYGQNFIIDEKAIEIILNSANIGDKDRVLEIGPGLGTLTGYLCEKSQKVIAVEIDKQIIEALRVNMSGYNNFALINEDFLGLDLSTIFSDNNEEEKYKVVANLPYYITSPIISKLLDEKEHIESITLMVQKEVAQRIAAEPGGKDFGILSVAIQYHSIPEIIAVVPASSFLPKPDVDSAIIHLKIRGKPAVVTADEKLFFRIVRASFAQRRKTLLNSLYGSDLKMDKGELDGLLSRCGIDSKRRAETLSLSEFANITNEISLFLKN